MICVYDASCQVTETLNGEYELTLIHPIDDYGKWQRLAEGNIVRVPVPAAMTPQDCAGYQQRGLVSQPLESEKQQRVACKVPCWGL